MKSKAIAFAFFTVFTLTNWSHQVNAVLINFDDAQAGYTPPPIIFSTSSVRDHFAPLGVLFRDLSDPLANMTAINGGFCGLCSQPVLLRGVNGSTQFDFETIFVDPTNQANAGFTTSVSGLWTDASQGSIPATAEAFDVNGISLGVASGSPFNGSPFSETLSLSGIGQIHRVIWRTGRFSSGALDATSFDNLNFSSVQALAVPEPGVLALIGFSLAGIGIKLRRKAPGSLG